ncbi:MAG: septum formation initiator family protein [Bacteroidaceae bacterium]|nr:septum formation initiator family protein [Bacteroidaceae bacterium]
MKHSIKYWIFKLKYLVALAIFIGAVGFVGENCVVKRIGQQQEIAKLKSEIDEYNRKFDKDKQTLNALKHDQDAIREVARQRYYMKTDDEDIFIIEDNEE